MTRRSRFGFEHEVDPVACLESLRSNNPNCYAFLLEPEAGTAFLGLPPERLLRLRGRRLQTEAVAGTADIAEAAALLDCEKNHREHRYVSEHIRNSLASLGAKQIDEKARHLVNLSNVAHIATRFEAELAAGMSLDRIIGALHPTPAVCGTTPAAALQAIRRSEASGRGWYTGVVGLIEADSVEMAVAIRSAVVAGNNLTAFAGAGIVAGSQPTQEWMELESKIQPLLDSFTGA